VQYQHGAKRSGDTLAAAQAAEKREQMAADRSQQTPALQL
jgi:hypothetical protein